MNSLASRLPAFLAAAALLAGFGCFRSLAERPEGGIGSDAGREAADISADMRDGGMETSVSMDTRDGGTDAVAADDGRDAPGNATDALDGVPAVDAPGDARSDAPDGLDGPPGVDAAPDRPSDAGADGPSDAFVCPTSCTAGHRRCQNGSVEECAIVAGCPTWNVVTACHAPKACKESGATASCLCASAAWQTEAIESAPSGRIFGTSSIAVGPDGQVHVVYYARHPLDNVNVIMHGRRGQPWTTVELDRGSVTNPNVTVDGRGGIHAAFVRYTVLSPYTETMRHGFRPPGGQWSLTDVASGNPNIGAIDMAADDTQIYIAHEESGALSTGYELTVRRRTIDATQWTRLPVIAEKVVLAPDITLVMGQPRLTFYDKKFTRVAFTNTTTYEEVEQTVDPNGYETRLGFDAAGGTHVLAAGPGLRHLYKPPSGLAWQSSVVLSSIGAFVDGTVDAAGTVHVLYSEGAVVKYGSHAWGGTLTPVDVNPPQITPYAAAIAVDNLGVHLSYREQPSEVMRYAFLCRDR